MMEVEQLILLIQSYQPHYFRLSSRQLKTVAYSAATPQGRNTVLSEALLSASP
jgi:hypothetical protein